MVRYCLLLLLFPLLAGAGESLPPGAVASVNGQAITLRQIEDFHDVSGGALVMAQSPSVELLQEQYGSSLFALIVQALMQQELERRGLSVTAADVLKAENGVRAEYASPDVFEKELQEEYIDLAVWRELMRQSLVTQRFQQRVLRPRFSITPEEVATYYTQNKAKFRSPEQVELFWIQDTDKAVVETLRGRWIKEQSRKAAAEKDAKTAPPEDAPAKDADSKPDFGGSESTKIGESERLRVSPARLPAQLRKDIGAVQPGQATPVRQEGGLYQFAVLCQTFPARNLSVAEAFPFIEQLLIEARLEPAYSAWIEETLPQATIRITPGLTPGRPLPESDALGSRSSSGRGQENDDAPLPAQ